jgi:hypothetical protein
MIQDSGGRPVYIVRPDYPFLYRALDSWSIPVYFVSSSYLGAKPVRTVSSCSVEAEPVRVVSPFYPGAEPVYEVGSASA